MTADTATPRKVTESPETSSKTESPSAIAVSARFIVMCQALIFFPSFAFSARRVSTSSTRERMDGY